MTARHPQAAFAVAAASAADFLDMDRDEFAVVGRSNVGKSSFLSHVFGARGLAHVSSRPGKTVTANFYRVDDGTCWVDLPGYGYARLPAGEKQRIQRLTDAYFAQRGRLRGVIWLLDVRHTGLPADAEAWRWLSQRRLPVLGVLTKCDKVSRRELDRLSREHRAHYAPGLGLLRYSVHDDGAREAFWQTFGLWRASAAGAPGA